MKRQALASLLAALAASAAQASQHPLSATRLPGEDYQEARARFLGKNGGFPRGSAEASARPVEILDLTLATNWDSLGSFEGVTQAFAQVRDVRFMALKNNPTFQRRISWLYPDDGCWARAASAELKYAEFKYPLPGKVFIFGDLAVKTPNAPGGEVGWWYHVAPVISFKGAVFVLDAAVEPKYPLPLKDWISRVSPHPKEVTLSLCGPGAYGPSSNCSNSDLKSNNYGPKDEKHYLKTEWKRIVRLKRDPVAELGERPPW